ncbi:MAG: zinc finger domain-containing protein, partial [Cyanobacteria bacterium P01_D01_bin.73]
GSSLEAKVLFYAGDEELRDRLAKFNPGSPLEDSSNKVDELRYLFITSEVDLVMETAPLNGLKYALESESRGIGVITASGKKCERCWDYSETVGDDAEDPDICARCVEALKGKF